MFSQIHKDNGKHMAVSMTEEPTKEYNGWETVPTDAFDG